MPHVFQFYMKKIYKRKLLIIFYYIKQKSYWHLCRKQFSYTEPEKYWHFCRTSTLLQNDLKRDNILYHI